MEAARNGAIKGLMVGGILQLFILLTQVSGREPVIIMPLLFWLTCAALGAIGGWTFARVKA